jgi:hypothetical protein
VLSESDLDGTEQIVDVDYQDAGKMKIHVGSSRPAREGGLFYAAIAKQSLAATHRMGWNPRSYSTLDSQETLH